MILKGMILPAFSALVTGQNLVLIRTLPLSSCAIRQVIQTSLFLSLSLQNKDTDAIDILKVAISQNNEVITA